MLNCSKSEIIFTARGKRGKSVRLPSPCLDIERVSSLRVLGVIENDQLTATDHVSNILASCNSLLYALRILRSHGSHGSASGLLNRTLVVPRYRLTTYGRRAFSVAGPPAWNSLPVAFRDPTISDACFRRHLKTVLFAQQRRHHSV